MAQVVYNNATEGAHLGGALFSGTKFWLAQRIPMRKHYIEQVKANGGQVVPLEKQADILIVDHLRKDVPPGTHSWTYIDQSIKKGALEDLQDHIAGPPAGTIRAVGSITMPARGIRRRFTQEDDHVLYEWVVGRRRNGDKILGNEIYKQLEAINPRHPWQSWRDRWVKYLSNIPPPATRPDSPPPSPSSVERQGRDQNGGTATPTRETPRAGSSSPWIQVVISNPRFTEDDEKLLLDVAADIENVRPDRYEEALDAWANEHPHHTAIEWRNFFEKRVLPVYKADKENVKTTAAVTSDIGIGNVATPIVKRTPLTASRGDFSAYSSPKDLSRRPIPKQASKSPSFEPDSPSLPEQIQQSKLNSAPVTSDQPLHKPTGEASKFSPSIRLKRTVTGNVDHSERQAEPTAQSPDLFLEDEHPGPFLTNRSVSPDSFKRKRVESIDEPASSPAKSITPPAKRQRRPVSFQNIIEIPSTPEKDTSPPPESDQEEEWTNQEFGRAASETLSEPARHAPQPSFANSIPIPDLDLAEPEGGWDGDIHSEINNSQANLSSKPSPDADAQPDSLPLDTQAILNAPTQLPDLYMPDPDGGWHTILPSLPPAQKPASSQSAAQESNAGLDAWIDSRVAAGISEEDVLLSLRAATMQTGLAEIVLGSLKKGEGVPRNVRGVWTAEDDEELEGGNGRVIEALQGKHGEEAFNARYLFLDEYRRRGGL